MDQEQQDRGGGKLETVIQKKTWWPRRIAEFVAATAVAAAIIATFVMIQRPQPAANVDFQNWQRRDVAGQEYFDKGQLKEAREQFEESLHLARDGRDVNLELASLNELLDLTRAEGGGKGDDQRLKEEISLRAPNVQALVSSIDKSLAVKSDGASDERDVQAVCDKANDVAAELLDARQFKSARTVIVKTRELLDRVPPASSAKARCFQNFGTLLLEEGDYNQSITILKSALELEGKSSDGLSPLMARSYYELGRAYLGAGKPDLAEKNIRVAQQLSRHLHGPNSIEAVNCKIQLALIYEAAGSEDKAVQEAKSAVDICEAAKDVKFNTDCATAYSFLGRIGKEQRLLQLALRLCEHEVKKPYQLLGEVLLELAELTSVKSGDRATALLDRAYAVGQRFEEPTHDAFYANLHQLRGELYLTSGNPNYAKDSFEQALALRKKVYGNNCRPMLAESIASIAIAEERRGDSKAAEKMFKSAFAMLIDSNPDTPVYVRVKDLLQKEYVEWLKGKKRASDAAQVLTAIESAAKKKRKD